MPKCDHCGTEKNYCGTCENYFCPKCCGFGELCPKCDVE